MRIANVVGAAVFASLMSFGNAPVVGAPITSETGPNLVSNPGFEDTTQVTGSGWAATGFLFEGFDYFVDTDPANAHSGNHSFAGGGIGQPGYLSQVLATIPGRSYNIHVWLGNLAGFADNTLFEIWWDGNLVHSQSNILGFSYNEIFVDPVASTSLTELRFGLQNDAAYLNIDDVSVRLVVPLPATLALLAIGCAAGALIRRRRVAS